MAEEVRSAARAHWADSEAVSGVALAAGALVVTAAAAVINPLRA